jgi:hypothetical protein
MNDSGDWRGIGDVDPNAVSCTATAWVKGPSGGTRSLKLRLREYSATLGGLVGSNTASVAPNGSWQQLSVSYNLAGASESDDHIDLNAYMTNASANDVVRVDSFTETCS